MNSEIRLAEYVALRETIRERSTIRMCANLAGLLIWAAVAVGLSAIGDAQRASVIVPFVTLVATFEVSFFLHTNVERIGRYLQVFHEARSDDPSEPRESKGWEHTIMDYGRRFPGGADPLFVNLFVLAATVDFFVSSAAAALRPGWIAISLVAHVVFAWRLFNARSIAGQQRTADLERFRTIQKSDIADPRSN